MGARRVLVLAVVIVLLGGCSADGATVTPPPGSPAPATPTPATPTPGTPTPQCGDFAGAGADPSDSDWFTIHLGLVALPTRYTLDRPLTDRDAYVAPDGTSYYFLKSGVPVWDRTVVTITSADGTALMNLNSSDRPPMPSQTLGPCGEPGTWHVYGAGGFYVPAEGCYDFVVEADGRRTTVTIPVGVGC